MRIVISHNDAIIYKAIAILCISIHNFTHWLPYSPGENEFKFNEHYWENFVQLLAVNPFNALFSFYGHYFVQVFIFLSAYGLALKYIKDKPNYKSFLLNRIDKIYLPFSLAIVLVVIIREGLYIFENFDGVLNLSEAIKAMASPIVNGILKMLLISPYLIGFELSGSGPWWFVPFIMQLYIVFSLLMRISNSGAFPLLMLGLAGLLMTYLFDNIEGGLNLRFNPIGHLPVICLGIYLARYEINKSMFKLIIVSSFIISFLSNTYFELWYLGNVSILIILLFVLHVVAKLINCSEFIRKYALFIGEISIYIFLVNGVVRELFIPFAMGNKSISIEIFLVLSSLSLTIGISYLLFRAEEAIRQKRYNIC